MIGSGCSDDEQSSGTLVCDPAAPACEDGLVCVEQEQGDALCQIPPGATCDPAAEKQPSCSLGSECLENPEAETDEQPSSHVCLVVEAGKCDPIQPYCAAPLTCAEVAGEAEHRCFAPLLVLGTVTDSQTGAAVAGAHVIALDEEGMATTDVATSDAGGEYALEVPAARDAEGKPLIARFTLRAAAQDYQVFPGGLRTALPLSTSDAVSTDDAWMIEGAPTAITLIALEGGRARHVVSGHLGASQDAGDPDVRAALSGVLIVASGAATQSALTDRGGNFTLFNIEDGSYTVKGYAAGVKVAPLAFDVRGGDVNDIALTAELGSLATVAGSVQIVNAAGGALTSVILVVDDTFDETFARGDVPRGLRAPKSGTPSIAGGFTIEDVPEGRYVVLAAFENDRLVRDPDTNIGGTDLVRITVGSSDVSLSESFKVTEALAMIAPGAEMPEAVSEAPLLTWADDSSEDWYEVVVYDAFGEEVWRADDVPSVSGSDDVTLRYAGPLDVGMYYQFRVTSWRAPGGRNPAPISATEDLRGVFHVEP